MNTTTNTTTAAVAILQPANVQQIVQLGPAAFNENTISHDRCISAGQELLSKLSHEGMSDQLDQQIATYIERARLTLNKMNIKRSPVTKLFDEIRTVFTTLEADVDPRRASSIPGQLQQHRDKYAAYKRQQAEAARQEEVARQMLALAQQKYRTELEEAYKAVFNKFIAAHISALSSLEASLTIETYGQVSDKLAAFPVTLDAPQWLASNAPSVPRPHNISPSEAVEISSSVSAGLAARFAEQYTFEIEPYRDEIQTRLPSRLAELKRIAQSSADEAARIKADLDARQQAEALRRQQEQDTRQARDAAQTQLQAQKNQMQGLFDMARVDKPEYTPKTSVRKRIVPLCPEAFMSIVGLWWTAEGQFLSVDELSKIFKRMLTFCEKAANEKENPTLIQNEYVTYQDEVKAK